MYHIGIMIFYGIVTGNGIWYMDHLVLEGGLLGPHTTKLLRSHLRSVSPAGVEQDPAEMH